MPLDDEYLQAMASLEAMEEEEMFYQKPRTVPKTAAPVQSGEITLRGHDDGLDITVYEAPPLVEVNEDREFYRDNMFPAHPKTGLPTLNYMKFEETYIKMRALRWSNGFFLTPKGEQLTENQVGKDITQLIRKCKWNGDASRMTSNILKSVIRLTDEGVIEAKPDIIPFSNGDLHIKKDGWEFVQGQFTYIPYRLQAKYYAKDVEMPLFSKWLEDAFYPEDIVSIQMFLGAMFLPENKIQEMMILYGDGGLGKSVLGNILNAIFGNAMVTTKLQTLAESPFEASRLQYKLVAYDDDMGSAALQETGSLKELITSEKPVRAERKYQNAFEFRPYATFLACTNMPLESLYDTSEGFFRRCHTIVTKPKDPNRVDIKDLSDRIIKDELNQVVRWMLQGTKKLIDAHYEIPMSETSKAFRDGQRSDRNHLPDFFDDCLTVGKDQEISSKDLSTCYRTWCSKNDLKPIKPAKFKRWITDQGRIKGYRANNHVNRTNSAACGVRGFKGLGLSG